MKQTLINPVYYTEATSLQEDISFACDANNELDLVLLANIVVKYLYAYLTGVYNQPITLDNLLLLISSLELVSHSQVSQSDARSMYEANVEGASFATRYHLEYYPVNMLLDIPSTVEIVRDIANRLIDPT